MSSSIVPGPMPHIGMAGPQPAPIPHLPRIPTRAPGATPPTSSDDRQQTPPQVSTTVKVDTYFERSPVSAHIIVRSTSPASARRELEQAYRQAVAQLEALAMVEAGVEQ